MKKVASDQDAMHQCPSRLLDRSNVVSINVYYTGQINPLTDSSEKVIRGGHIRPIYIDSIRDLEFL